jgi:superfamily I DNA/RNA helicase
VAALIPAMGTCVSRMTGGEKRFAYRLKSKLEDDWLCWYDVPLGVGRHAPKPLLIKLPTIQVEADYIANLLKETHKTGTPWSDMAVICRDYGIGKPVLATLRKAGIPVTCQDDITFAEREDSVKFLTVHSCKGLEFPLVAIQGAGRAVDEGRNDEGVRLLHVAMTRAIRALVVAGCEPN